MADYNNTFDGAGKDAATATILGADFDTQFDSIASMSADKIDKVNAVDIINNIATYNADGSLKDSGIDVGGLSTTELAILDGATITTAELNVLSGAAAGLTGTELSVLDGITATTAQLNDSSLISGINSQQTTNTTNISTLQGQMTGTLNSFTAQAFTSSGTWTRPAGCIKVHVTVIGGGGRGASTDGIPGGGGGYTKAVFDVTGTASTPVTVGQEGTFTQQPTASSFLTAVGTAGVNGTGVDATGTGGYLNLSGWFEYGAGKGGTGGFFQGATPGDGAAGIVIVEEHY